MAEYSQLDKLIGPSNARRWRLNAVAALGRKRVRYVIEANSAPTLSIVPTDEEERQLQKWREDCDVACGIIWDGLDESIKQYQAVQDAMLASDARALWLALEREAVPVTVSARFGALIAAVNVRMTSDQSLEALVHRVKFLLEEWRGLWPSDFTLERLFQELILCIFLHALPVERQPFSSGLLQKLGHVVRFDSIKDACRVEDSQQVLYGNPAASAMASRINPRPAIGSSSSSRTSTSSSRTTVQQALASLHAALGQRECYMCEGRHATDKCEFLDIGRKAAIEARKLRNQSQRQIQGDRRAGPSANLATVTATITEVDESNVALPI